MTNLLFTYLVDHSISFHIYGTLPDAVTGNVTAVTGNNSCLLPVTSSVYLTNNTCNDMTIHVTSFTYVLHYSVKRYELKF